MGLKEWEIETRRYASVYAYLRDIAKYAFLIPSFFIFEDLRLFIFLIAVLQYFSDHLTVEMSRDYVDNIHDEQKSRANIINTLNYVINISITVLVYLIVFN